MDGANDSEDEVDDGANDISRRQLGALRKQFIGVFATLYLIV